MLFWWSFLKIYRGSDEVRGFRWSCLIFKGETEQLFYQYRTQITTNIHPYLNMSTCVKHLFKEQEFGGEINTNWNLIHVRIYTDIIDWDSCSDTFHLAV